MTHSSVLLRSVLCFILLCGTALAQSNRVYVDSVEAVPGTDLTVDFNMENSASAFSVTVPIIYDTALLTLKEISVTGSRGAHVATRYIVPQDIATAQGHFMVVFLSIVNDSIPPGNGLLFKARFGVDSAATPGTVTSFDTLFYPPGGEFIFVDSQAHIVYPEFDGGKVMIANPNSAPVFVADSGRSVNEGDSLIFSVQATDADNDSVSVYPITIPNGSTFSNTGNGSGVLRWKPEFVGPASSAGSPFNMKFGATDGMDSTTYVIPVTVINVNRPPVINLMDTVTVTAGDSVSVNVSANEKDFEPVAWDVIGLPSRASFSFTNPGKLSWRTLISEHGFYPVKFIGSDSLGASDTATVVIVVRQATLYFVSIDSGYGRPGETVTVDLLLENLEPVAGFNLLLHYDPAHLALVGIDKTGTFSQGFETFDVINNEDGIKGNVRIEAVADEPGGPVVGPIAVGSGAIARLTFRIAGGLNLGGYNTPIQFTYLAPSNDYDNTILDASSIRVPTANVDLTPGMVSIEKIGEVSKGDINLNSVTYEIGDVILFGNYLINPVAYPLSALQLVNTNVNGDAFVATVADYVTLVNILASGGPSSAPNNSNLNAKVMITPFSSGATVTYFADFEAGGIAARFEIADTSREIQIENLQPQMDMVSARVGSELRVIWHSMDGGRLPQGEGDLIRFTGETEMTIKEIEVGTAAGEVTHASVEVLLPVGFALSQNYPNPFNPETRIDFSLAAPGSAEIAVFNVLGHEIKKIHYRELSAGQHSVVWDGRNESGNPVASGIYFYRLTISAGSLTRKMTLVK